MSTQRCGDAGGVAKGGAPCRARLNLSPTNGRCLMHDEERVDEYAALRRAGAKGRREQSQRQRAFRIPRGLPTRPETIEDAKRYASWAVDALGRGEIDTRTAREIGGLLREFRSACEKSDLAKEIAEVRAMIVAQGNARP